MNQAEFDQYVKQGLRNQEVITLIHNYCTHARVVSKGGVGVVAEMTGLPLGMLGVDCDNAPVRGLDGWRLQEVAVDFYDRNCAHCDKRSPLRLPNLLQLVDARDKAAEARRLKEEAAKVAAERAHQVRISKRITLRVGQSAACCALLDDIDALDVAPSDEVKARIVETAKLAPEIFSAPIVEYFFELANSSLMNLQEQALLALQHVASDKQRLSEAALDCLAKGRAIDVSAEIVLARPAMGDEARIERAVPALISLAKSPDSGFPFSETEDRPDALLALYRAWPAAVRRVTQELLDTKESYKVRLGVAALQVLSLHDPELLTHFARTTISKLTRAHLLLEDIRTEQDLNRACSDLRRVVASTLLVAPEKTDSLIATFFEGASTEGEERLVRVYEELSRRSIQSRSHGISKFTPNEIADAIVLKRLLKLASTCANMKVLTVIAQLIQSEPDELVSVGAKNMDALLGTAAVMDARIESFHATKRENKSNDLLEHLETRNSAHTLYQLRAGCASLAATAARGDKTRVESYIAFVANVDSQRDGLISALIEATPHLVDSPTALNVALPQLYSSLVTTSVLRRTAAAKALAKFGAARISDLPELVLEAFALLLTDPYVMVHQGAVHALSSVPLPKHLEQRAAAALLQLIIYYSGKADQHDFLVRCIRLYLSRFASESELRAGIDALLVKYLMDTPAQLHASDFAQMAKSLAQAPNFVNFVIHVLDTPELSEYGARDSSRLLHRVPATEASARASDFADLAKRHPDRFPLVESVVELLSRIGAWTEAIAAIQGFCEAIPDNMPSRRLKWNARLHVLAVKFEAAVASGDVPQQEALKKEWLQIEAAIEKDNDQYSRRRNAFPNFH